MARTDDRAGTVRTQNRMPVVFVGHGSPMNAVEDNRWSRGFAALGQSLPRPTAILSVSAHWFVGGTFLTAQVRPETIHDFGGFPRALYEIEYPAPGKVDLAEQVRTLLAPTGATLSTEWGLDHGTWSVLKWMFPRADIPVVQLSIDRRLGPEQHYALARSLVELRDQGVLVMGSGNVVHNLGDAFRHMRTGSTETPTWARRFDQKIEAATRAHDDRTLVRALDAGEDDARRSHPTPDHWLPFLYALALTDARDAVRFPIEGFDLGSLSMRSVLWG